MKPNLLMRTPIDQLKREAIAAVVIEKPVMIDGRWVTRPYVLTRGPNGLSDRPVNAKPGATK